MMEWLIQNESGIRMAVFLGTLGLMVVWKWTQPARKLMQAAVNPARPDSIPEDNLID